jgi:hypothetical protein
MMKEDIKIDKPLKKMPKENNNNTVRHTLVWPGSNRGWGPITRELEGERADILTVLVRR